MPERPKGVPDLQGDDFSAILKWYELSYSDSENYWQVGEIKAVQGWIIHVSSVLSEIRNMLSIIIPYCLKNRISFKIIKDRDTCSDMLNGFIGLKKIGKVICLYPEEATDAVLVASELVRLTQRFKGPTVLTDRYLGGCVYTRYGSFNPVMIPGSNGKEEAFIYTPEGELVKDGIDIPFILPKNIVWPFGKLATHDVPPTKKILKHIYRPVSLLKADARGNVYKGLYLKSLLQIWHCVIKEGLKNMSSDDDGRDISDRLVWQRELYLDVCDTVALPEVYDLFTEDQNTYLVMEFIQGHSLSDQVAKLNPRMESWYRLPVDSKITILGYLLQVVDLIEKLHQKGYVHRDVAPGNFMIDKKGRMLLVDLELSYSTKRKYPTPPFKYGTAGFMSPEQKAVMEPTTKEDIYGLGALILNIMTGISPVKFDQSDNDSFTLNIYYFIQHDSIAKVIAACMDSDPSFRPSLAVVRETFTKVRSELSEKTKSSVLPSLKAAILPEELKGLIANAIRGLQNSSIAIFDDYWYSKKINDNVIGLPQYKEYSRYGGLKAGMGGVLYLLGRAKKAGIDISHCENSYRTNWVYIENHFLNSFIKDAPGLYDGAAGLAMVIKEGLDSGIMENDAIYIQKMQECLQSLSTDLTLGNGIAGQGVALFNCRPLLPASFFNDQLLNIEKKLLTEQQKDGSWMLPISIDGIHDKANLSFGYGVPGIIWYLLSSIGHANDRSVQQSAEKSLSWLLKRINPVRNMHTTDLFEKKVLRGINAGDEKNGIILTFIKAYEVLGNNEYKAVAEEILSNISPAIVDNNLTQWYGLSGLGEVFLEAWRVFRNEEWRQRADWIAGIFENTFQRNDDGSGRWLIEENDTPTADLLVGNSGIIHFLLRCLYPEDVGYRLLQ